MVDKIKNSNFIFQQIIKYSNCQNSVMPFSRAKKKLLLSMFISSTRTRQTSNKNENTKAQTFFLYASFLAIFFENTFQIRGLKSFQQP